MYASVDVPTCRCTINSATSSEEHDARSAKKATTANVLSDVEVQGGKRRGAGSYVSGNVSRTYFMRTRRCHKKEHISREPPRYSADPQSVTKEKEYQIDLAA